MKNSPIRSLSWASVASRRLFSSSTVALVESSESLAEVQGKREDFVPFFGRLCTLSRAPPGSVFKTMNRWTREGRPTKAKDLRKCVKELTKYRRHKQALELMDWMVKVRGMSRVNHEMRIELVLKVKGIEAAEDYFSQLPEPAKTGLTYRALFDCYCSEKMLDKALEIFEKMKQLGFPSDKWLYGNLMSLYVKVGQPEKVPGLLQEMKANSLDPSTINYCMVMNSYGAMNDIDSVERLVCEMEGNKELTVQWNAYSTLAAIYISAGHLQKAESALKKLEGLIDGSDHQPFCFLVSLYASTGNLEEVKRVWKSYKAKIVKYTNNIYLTMLRALDKVGDIEGLTQYYGEWETVYMFYDTRLTNTVISSYLGKDMIEEAESLYARTKEKEGELDIRTCELFMGYYLRKNEISSALNWLEVADQMVEDVEWKLDAEKVGLFLQHYERTKDLNGIEKFRKIMMKLNCLSPRAYESLTDILGTYQ